MLTQKRLKELLHYDPATGVFTWIVYRCNFAKAGDIAGNESQGYSRIKVDMQSYPAHRLVFLYMIGHFPDDEVDHKNSNKLDNRFDNLRQVTRRLNSQNLRGPLSNNKSGFLGVVTRGKRFAARIGINKRQIHLGYYDSPQQAYDAYLSMKRKIHSACTL